MIHPSGVGKSRARFGWEGKEKAGVVLPLAGERGVCTAGKTVKSLEKRTRAIPECRVHDEALYKSTLFTFTFTLSSSSLQLASRAKNR